MQNFSGANFTVDVYIYATFRDSEERFTCRPTCRYNSYSIFNRNVNHTPPFFECCMNNRELR